MRHALMTLLAALGFVTPGPINASNSETTAGGPVSYIVYPIGWVRRSDDKTFIEVDKRFLPALMGVDELKSIWVLYWFDRNDTPQKRSMLRVHPRGNPDNPLRGVFATRSPLRPNPIALSQVNVLSVRGSLIEIDGIDAFDDTPVLDIKP
jgi:tRNA-Thr(GGU) m(6)t(6)A37 methyltransferase TsaA